MDNWKEIRLDELIKFQRGHDLTKAKFIVGKFPVAGSNGIIGYHNDFTTKGPGLTIGRSGNSIGVPHFYNDDFWAHNTTLYSKKLYGNDVRYIYYLLHTFNFKFLNSGSAVPSLNRNHIHSIKILVPEVPEQKAIAQVLSSLDDKIDLLHRQNKTLEAMAEALFRQWFVEEAEDDWEEKPLSHIATFLNGLACQKYPPTNVIDKLPVLKIRELKDGFTDNSDWVSTDIPDKYFVSNGDVIFSWSASLLVKIWDGTDCILNQHLFKVTSELYPKWFYYLWSKYHLDQFIAIARAHATTMGHIKRGDLDEALVFIPPEEILQKMDYSFDPIIEKIIANNKQLTSLTNLRDTLLPKLMSGEVRVKITEDGI